MQTAPPSLDPVAVLIVLLSPFFGPAMAGVIGPYAVILLGAIGGAVYSASGRPTETGRLGIIGYMLVMVIASVGLTVAASELAASRISVAEPRYLFFPMSMLISGIGWRWPSVVQWAWGLLRGIAERWAASRGNQPPPPGGMQ